MRWGAHLTLWAARISLGDLDRGTGGGGGLSNSSMLPASLGESSSSGGGAGSDCWCLTKSPSLVYNHQITSPTSNYNGWFITAAKQYCFFKFTIIILRDK